MKLFIDTSNKKLILAIIDNENNVIDFFLEETNNDVVKNALPYLEKLIKKNNFNISDFDDYMITIGPGSFTGVKVALNIVRTINLVNPIKKIYTIDTFKLIDDKKRYIAIPFGKNKFYLKDKKHFLSKVKIINNIDVVDKNKINFGYDNFDKNKLMEKINNKSFKLLDNLDKVKIKYITKF